MDQAENKQDNEILQRQIEVTERITGRTLTLDEARQVQEIAALSLKRGKR